SLTEATEAMSGGLEAVQMTSVAQAENDLQKNLNSKVFECDEKFETIDSCRIRYLTAGCGPPLLFIHGLLGYSFSWRFNLSVIAKRAKVLALDLPGTGFSDRPRVCNGSLRALADCVLSFCSTLGIVSTGIVGSSHGGAVAMLTAAIAQERGIRVDRLVLVSPVNPWSSRRELLLRFLACPVGAAGCRLIAPLLAPLHAHFHRRMYGDPSRI